MSVLQGLRYSAQSGSPAIRKVGEWMALHPLKAISLSADEIAVQAHASQSAVNRFATHAGFSSMAELRAALTAELQDVQEPIAKLQRSGDLSSEHPFADAQAGLLQAAHGLDIQALERCASTLLKARHVYTLGLGMSHFAAGFAASALLPYVQGATHVSEGGGAEQIARRMMHLGQGDVLMAIAVPRYSMDTVTLAGAARSRGAFVVAVTDKMASPLAPVADLVMLAPAEHRVMSHSYVSIVALIEAVTASVMRLNPKAASITTDMYDAVLPHLLQMRRR